MATTTWRDPDGELYERLRREAFESRRSINELITEAVQRWLETRQIEREAAR